MTNFLDCRMAAVGGELATSVAVNQGTTITDYSGLLMADLLAAIDGRNVLIGVHGFNVNRADGIAALANYDTLLQLPAGSAFLGLLWPGDSVWAHGLDYPDEPKVADAAGALLAPFIDQVFAAAASVSFCSHSLGARVVLATVSLMQLPVRRVLMMAGAVDDNCLDKEFAAVAAKVDEISLLCSRKDKVLAMAFPLGNIFSGIIAAGHPWWHAALGHAGANTPWPSNLQSPCMIPDNWDYQHSNYLEVVNPAAAALPIPTAVPPNGALPLYANSAAGGQPPDGWQSTFSAAFISSRFR